MVQSMNNQVYQRSDFVNSNEVRWCPGCGDYAILAGIQKMLPELGLPPEKHVFVSGIGCAGRLPYYMNTYGFHTIHGRALAVATGLKSMRDDLSVWVITGDGDCLSIGGNHFIHALRRNIDVNILLINNQVYGLTKGQFSPTSKCGQITKTSPEGVKLAPINPIALALGAGASFVARCIDKDPVHLKEVLMAAHAHKGVSLIEIYQDCHIFNEGAFDEFSAKANRAARTIYLEHGKPLVFGEQDEKCLIIDNNKIYVNSATENNFYLHDVTDLNAAQRLANLSPEKFPIPLGIYYKNNRQIFSLDNKILKSKEDVELLYRKKAFWRNI